MSDYYIATPVIGAPGPITASHTAPQYPLGLEVVAVDRAAATGSAAIPAAGVFVYCRGSDVASRGAFVSIHNGSAVMVASAGAASAIPIGVAAAVLTATSHYGWVQVQGRCDYARGTNVGMTAGVPRYLGGTAGILLSNAAAGQRVQGVGVPFNQTATATVSASGTVDLFRPFVVGASAAL